MLHIALHHMHICILNTCKKLAKYFWLPSMALLKMTRHSTGFSTKSAVSVARAGSTMKGTRNMRTENPEIAIREKEKVA